MCVGIISTVQYRPVVKNIAAILFVLQSERVLSYCSVSPESTLFSCAFINFYSAYAK
jgi:hypothetical protein